MASRLVRVSVLSVIIALGAGTAQAQPGAGAAPSAPEMTEIANGIYLFAGGSGANSSALISPETVLLVDSKTDPSSAESMVNDIASDFSATIEYLINTHEHPDHTGGNELIAEQGATIIAQQGVFDVLAAGQRGGPPAPQAALPALTIDPGQSLRLHLGGQTVDVRDMPASHTAANVMVHYVEADIFHLGDIYTRTRYPVIAGGSLQGFIDSVDIILGMADANSKFIPGVGEIGDVSDLRAYRNMLVTVGDRVAELVERGNSLEEVSAANPTAEFDATYGDPGRLFLPVIYNQLAEE